MWIDSTFPGERKVHTLKEVSQKRKGNGIRGEGREQTVCCLKKMRAINLGNTVPIEKTKRERDGSRQNPPNGMTYIENKIAVPTLGVEDTRWRSGCYTQQCEGNEKLYLFS